MHRHLIGWCLALALVGCAGEPARPTVQLSDLQPLPAVESSQVMPLKVAVAAVISPQGTAESYQPLLDVLADKLDRPIQLVQRRTYAEVNDLVRGGGVDVAFVCTAAYVEGHDAFGMELLAAPQVNGEVAYYSVLIVPSDSPATGMADLRGKIFAFTDPLSNTGRNYPMWLVAKLGETPETLFARTFYTYSHDDAIRAVADRMADGAAVDSLVYDYALSRDPSLAERVRVIHTSPPFGIPPVVVGPAARPQLKAELEALLLGLVDDPAGQDALRAIGVERFVPIDDAAYDSVRVLSAELAGLIP